VKVSDRLKVGKGTKPARVQVVFWKIFELSFSFSFIIYHFSFESANMSSTYSLKRLEDNIYPAGGGGDGLPAVFFFWVARVFVFLSF
jgi:hypothetical protein